MQFIKNKPFIAALLIATFAIACQVRGGVATVGEVTPTIDPGGYGINGQPNSVSGNIVVGINELGGVFINNDFGTGILINTGDGILGQNVGSSGALEITNFPLAWFMEGNFTVGDAGWGIVDLINSAKVQVGAPVTFNNDNVVRPPVAEVVADNGITTLGRQETGNGQMTLNNLAAQLVTNTLIVGDLGTGAITASARASLATGDAYIGNGDGSSGIVTITDPSTRWTVGTPPLLTPPTGYVPTPGTLTIGNAVASSTVGLGAAIQTGLGRGSVSIRNQGLVEVSENIIINPLGLVDLQTQGRLRVLPSSVTANAIVNNGKITGDGYVDFVGSILVNQGDGEIFNDDHASEGTIGDDQREKLTFTGGLLINNSTIFSDGGEMDFNVPVTNNFEIIARDAIMRFPQNLTNGATGVVVVGGNSTLHGAITPLPLSNFVILNDSIVTITGDLLFTEPFLLSDGDEGLVAASTGNEATLSIGIGDNPGYLTVTGDLDLTNAVLDLDFAGSTAPEIGDIINLIQVDGNVTGTFENSTVNVGGQVWEIDYSGGDISATFTGIDNLPGDFDGDGDVDGRDFLAWQRNPSVGNLGDWQSNFGQSGGSLTGNFASVPEPGTMLLVLTAAACCLGRRK
jgi:hypothetical protein